jgi:hypothetical protein
VSPGWSGCDVCDVIDSLRQNLGELGLPPPEAFIEPRFAKLEDSLRVAKNAPLATRALIVAEGLIQLGMATDGLTICNPVQQLIDDSDTMQSEVQKRIQAIRERASIEERRVERRNI